MKASLKVKLLGIAFLAVVLVTLGAGGVAYRVLYQEALKALDTRSRALVQTLAAQLTEYLLSNDLYGAHRLLKRVLDSEVRFAYVLDPKGSVLVHTFSEGFPQALLKRPGELDYQAGGTAYHQRAAPIQGGRLGEVRVGVSEAPLRVRLWVALWDFALAILGVALLVGGVTYRMAVAFLRPIEGMVRDVARLEAQEAGEIRVPEGELGVLARSLNAHFLRAHRREKELRDLNRVAQVVNRAETPEAVLKAALEALLATGRFRCGDAFLRQGEGFVRVASLACGRGDCPVALGDTPPGFQVVRLGQEAFLVLLGEEASPEFMEALFAPIAAGLERARYYESLREKEEMRRDFLKSLLQAQEEERARIARDLHDQVGQALTGLALGLEAAQREPNPERLRALKALVESTREDVRALARSLRPAVLDTLGLEAALKRMASEVSWQSGVRVEVLCTLSARLGSEEETALYRVAQEALTNAVRHAKASRVSILLTEGPKGVSLVVEDDGEGFDPARAGRGHLGLVHMRERVEVLGGQLELETAPGRGTSVYVHLPQKEAV